MYAPGGQGVFADSKQDGQLVIYYHYANETVGLADKDYQLGYNTLGWQDGWPVLK